MVGKQITAIHRMEIDMVVNICDIMIVYKNANI